jgi:TolB-like protein/DNA-binding winged helix-turn-helix (wHTH) protein/Tfp pilus assembly protein PilF
MPRENRAANESPPDSRSTQVEASTKSVIRFGVFELDLDAGELRKNGGKLRVEGQPLTILRLLLEHAGRVVTREELKEKLWSEQTFVDFDHSINVAIKRLRDALDDSAETPRYIQTLPRRGYRFIYPVNGNLAGAASVSVARRRQYAKPLASAILLIALPAAIWIAIRVRQVAAVPKIRSVAVLPLKNLSGDQNQQYFADGMTDAVITQLGRIGALRVISLQSVLRYRQASKPLPEIARELNVDAVIEGSVLRSGSQVRIDVQLIQADPERHLWANSFTGDESDVLRLQSEIAAEVAHATQVTIAPQQMAHLSESRRVDPRAYQAYLRGRELYQRFDDEWFPGAIENLQEAIRLDPSYAPPYATLAEIYSTDMQYSYQELHERAQAAADKGLQLDDSLPEAHAAQAYVNLRFRWDWAAAEREIKRAIELNPNNSEALSMYGYYLTLMGRYDESIVAYRRAIELDPLNFLPNERLGFAYSKAGRYDDAINHLERLAQIQPGMFMGHYSLAFAYVHKGNCQQGMQHLRKGGRHLDVIAQPASFDYAWVISVCGDRKAAEHLINVMTAYSRRHYLDPMYIAEAYAGLGEKARAIAWLEKGYKQRSRFMIYLRCLHELDNLRSEHRFEDLMRQMNFPQ